MMLKRFFLFKIYLLFFCLYINVDAKLPEGVVNEFRYAGDWLVCISDTFPSDLDEVMYLPCLNFKTIKIGSTLEEIESMYNDIYKIIPESDTVETRVYLLETELEQIPYIVVEYRNNVATALQLTGLQTNADLSFSSIKLGDPEKYVIEILGKPNSIEEVEEIDGYFWDYSPFPITVEMVDKKVYSVKIRKPEKEKE